jgi:hypothetical protein
VAVLILLAAGACSSGDEPSGAADDRTTSTATSGTDDVTDDPPADSLHIANLNVLHGLYLGGESCTEETEGCKAAVRLDMLWDLLESADCPQVVTLQEIGPDQMALIPATIGEVCDGAYSVVSETGQLPTENWILSTLPVVHTASMRMGGLSRQAQLVRVESPMGLVDVVTTHFVASVDLAPCTPQLCSSGVCEPGTDTRTCNAMEILDFLEREGDPTIPAFLTGDLNESIDGAPVRLITDTGFVDVWSEVGNAECDPTTAANCTGGQTGAPPFDGLDSADNVRIVRIDFILARSVPDCEVVVEEAGLFGGEPFDPPVEGIYWASDHIGVQTTAHCG